MSDDAVEIPTRVLAGLLLVGGAVTLTVALGTAAVAADAPGEPIAFYGEVVDGDGTPAPEGTDLVAAVDGDVVDRITVDERGVYAGDGPTDEKLRMHTGAGDTVTFHLGDGTGPTASEVHAIGQPGVYALDLTFPSDTFDDEGPGTGGGGFGGGGLGGDAFSPPDEDSGPVTEVAHLEFDEETATSVAEFTEAVPIVRIVFDGVHDVDEGIAVTALEDPPETVGRAAVTSLHTVRITVPDELATKQATIVMQPDPDLLEGVNEPDLRIRHHGDGEWKGLETEIDSTDDGPVVTATTPGFSYFSLVAVAPPTATITTDDEVVVGDVTLSAERSVDYYGEVETYEWTVAGDRLEGEVVTTTVDEPGDLLVELEVTNTDGLTDTARTTILVEAETTEDGESTDGTTDGVLGFVVVTAVVVLLVAGFALRRYVVG